LFQIKELISELSESGELEQDIIDDINWVINRLSDKALKAAFGDNEYEQAKAEIILLFPENQQSIIQQIFNEIETANLPPETIKAKLNEIYKLANQNKEKGIFETADVNVILADLCTILKYYNIPSQKCGTLPTTVNQEVSTDQSSSSLFKTIIKYVLIAFAVIFLLFIILVIIFAIKAKKEEEETQKEETSES
jgi:hypothetical protein